MKIKNIRKGKSLMKNPWIMIGAIAIVLIIAISAVLIVLDNQNRELDIKDPEESIPKKAVKISAETDNYPPKLHLISYRDPVALSYPVSSAGVEDNAFITYKGDEIYYFFTPDINADSTEQIRDGASGIYYAKKSGLNWTEPDRVVLSTEISLDDCVFVSGNIMWFCSERAPYDGVNLFTAEYEMGKWQTREIADQTLIDYEIEEMHMNYNGNRIYFQSSRAGGDGGSDIWVTEKVDGVWQEPINLARVNSGGYEGQPYVNKAETELWITKNYQGTAGVWVSKKVNNAWMEPEIVISQYAKAPSIDQYGHIYFTHDYYKDGEIAESDIYVAYNKN